MLKNNPFTLPQAAILAKIHRLSALLRRNKSKLNLGRRRRMWTLPQWRPHYLICKEICLQEAPKIWKVAKKAKRRSRQLTARMVIYKSSRHRWIYNKKDLLRQLKIKHLVISPRCSHLARQIAAHPKIKAKRSLSYSRRQAPTGLTTHCRV